MRILMLATYFPKPTNPLIGNWALAQAQAIRNQGVTIEVVSHTALVPSWLALTPGSKAYAKCPSRHDWESLTVHYPRWPVYPDAATRGLQFRNPRPFLTLGWATVRRRLLEYLEQFRPDVIYAHHTAVNGWIAHKLWQLTNIPYVVTDHDFGEVSACRALPRRRSLFAQVCSHAATMVSVASRMEREFQDLFPGVVTKTIPNGTDPIPPDLHLISRPEDLRNKTVVFSCGHFYPRKRFPFLISVFARLANQYPDAVLRIAGDGETRPQVEAEVKAHKLEGRVQLLGRISHAKVLNEMANADIFALFSKDEPFATVFSEAASAGKPILLCDDGGFCDVLESGVHGIAIPPDNLPRAVEALGRLLASPQERQRMGSQAKRLFESRLKWDHNATAMISLFDDAIRSKGVPADA